MLFKSPSLYASIRKLFSLLSLKEKIKWIVIVGFALCTSILEVATASFVVIFAQVLSQPDNAKTYMARFGIGDNVSSSRLLLYISAFCGIIYLIKNIVAGIEIFFQNKSIQKMNYTFKKKVLQSFAKIDYGFYLTRNSSYGNGVISDVEITFSNGMLCLANIISEAIVSSFLIAMIVYLNPSLAIFVFLIGGILTIAVSKGLFPLFYRWGQRTQEAAILATQNLMQFFHGFKEIILLGKRESFIDSYNIYSRQLAKIQAIKLATNALPRIIIETLFVGLFVSTIFYLFWEKDTPQQIMGTLGGYFYVAFRLMPGINRIINQLNTFKATIPSIDRVHSEFNDHPAHYAYLDIPNLRFDKNITLKSVSFQYLNTKKDALKNVSLEIRKGECIGIVGETGSGKSTLVDLILGLLRPKSGEILLDGKYPVCSHQWQKLLGYVPQSIYLTDDTIEANIAFGDSPELVDQERLQKSIDSAQLRTLINHLPNGEQTIVGERGIRLSGGERQRISIARALYRNPEILIFDEATSALDNETEARLMETIQAVSKTRTVIMVAHRLSTLKDCDRIVVMKDGEVSNITSYAQLHPDKIVLHA